MVKKWEIYYVDLNPTKGSEQKGIRPILVMSNNAVNDNLPVFTCIPFSSLKAGSKIYPTEVFLSVKDSGLPKDSVLMLQQIRTISIDRLSGDKIGEIKDDEIKSKIKQALFTYFELD
ncbi:MAG TPA: MazF family transcriptional regulator [Ruminococcaceae bacterium]|jgi:mRNA interferase MazF|nr:MazF family transcriptional regulator [Oscillospiraceae bacterium]